MNKKWTFRKIIQHFFQGVLVLAPIFLTFYAIFWIFNVLDGLFGFADFIPGLGLIIALAGITVVGYLSSFFIIGRLFDLFDRLLERTPVIKYIYTSIKDIFDALMGKKKKFDHPVLVHLYNDEVWEVGFITRSDATDFGLEGVVAVYVPMSLSIAGKVYFVKSGRVQPLNHISAGDAMKFAVSGGVTGGDGVSPVTQSGEEDKPEIIET